MPKKAKSAKDRPLYKSSPPKPGRAALLRSQADRQVGPTSDFLHPHFLAPSHFTLREDGSIQTIRVAQASGLSSSGVAPDEMTEDNRDHPQRASGATPDATGATPVPPRLIFRSESPFVRLYHGNCLELLDAIAVRYPEGRFDAIFADPPYFLSNGGITCHAGKMVKVDKGDWDVSRGPELNHEFNLEWLRRCQRVLKPNGTLWVSGTHHVIFSIGYALQQLGYKILNDIAWEQPNPHPNLSCRYFTHSTETILWAAKNDKSKHLFNYQAMRKVTGKQMKTVWRKEEFSTEDNKENKELAVSEKKKAFVPSVSFCSESEKENASVPSVSFCSNVWTLGAPGSDEKTFGKHPTQKPVALVERCLRASTNEGDLVLDPFLGNGTTAVAAVRLNRQCVGVEADLAHVLIAAKRCDREIISIWLRHFRVRIKFFVFGRATLPRRPDIGAEQQLRPTELQIDLDLFSDSINGSRCMADVPQIETERIFHECKFVFLSCAHVERGAVVHTTVDVSLQEAWAKTPNGKKRETTHVVRCETEIFRIKS